MRRSTLLRPEMQGYRLLAKAIYGEKGPRASKLRDKDTPAYKKQFDLMRDSVLLRDKYACCICGFTEALDVHHIVPRNEQGTNDISNLITICPNHHKLAHRGQIGRADLLRMARENNETYTRMFQESTGPVPGYEKPPSFLDGHS